jgi:hypothetical protein
MNKTKKKKIKVIKHKRKSKPKIKVDAYLKGLEERQKIEEELRKNEIDWEEVRQSSD